MKSFRSFLFGCLLTGLACGLPGEALPATTTAESGLEDAFVAISEKIGPAVVTIQVTQMKERGQPSSGNPYFDEFLNQFFYNVPRREYRSSGMGTGFIIDAAGYVLTNEHVVGDADEIEVTLPDGRAYEAVFVGSDPRSDIALIKIQGDNLPVVTIGDSDKVRPGQWSVAMGHPFGNIVNNPKPTMTVGVISAIHRSINVDDAARYYGDLIQTDASINQGNSGGPLINLSGDVIGINTLIFSPSGGNVGIGFAIPVNRAKPIIDDLISGREIKHGYLGIWLQDATRELKEHFGLKPEEGGALIFKVEPDSPALSAGFLPGDMILEIDGERVHNPSDVTRIVSEKRPGDTLAVLVLSDRMQVRLKPVIGERKKEEGKTSSVTAKKVDSRTWRGITVVDITDEIAEDLELDSRKGVVITRVKYGASTSRTGLRRGDVVFAIGSHTVNSAEEFLAAGNQHLEDPVLIHSSRGFVVLRAEKKDQENAAESDGDDEDDSGIDQDILIE